MVPVLVLPVLAALVSSCSSTPTEPTTVAPPSTTAGLVAVTETFSGTLVSGGTNIHTFHTMQGPLTVTLESLEPTDVTSIAVGIGMWDGLSCQLVLQAPLAGQGAALPGTASIETQVCIKVWDPGTLASDATAKYTVSAVHNEKPPS